MNRIATPADLALAISYPKGSDCEEIDRINQQNIDKLGITQRGAIVASAKIHRAISCKAFYAVKCWGNGRAPKRLDQLVSLCSFLGLAWEVSYDAAHGRRYRLCIYAPSNECRNATKLA